MKKELEECRNESQIEFDEEEDTLQEKEGSFRCKVCSKRFMRLMILINHCRREHPDRPEICPEEPLKLGLLETLHERCPDPVDNKFVCGLDLCHLRFDRYLSIV